MACTSGGSNKTQNTDHEGGGGGSAAQTTLAHVLLREKGLIYNLVSFTSVPQTSRLLTTCTELYTAEKVVLHKLPKVCDMSSSRWGKPRGNEFKLYGAIVVRAPNSRWLGWLDTSGVEELKLPQRVTDEETARDFLNFKHSTSGAARTLQTPA